MKGETIISFFCCKFHMKLCQKKMHPFNEILAYGVCCKMTNMKIILEHCLSLIVTFISYNKSPLSIMLLETPPNNCFLQFQDFISLFKHYFSFQCTTFKNPSIFNPYPS
jgi:hypothetical protein